jgi:acyl-CoA synthetase (NDP forming)
MKLELKKQLDYIFNPGAVAVIGASASPQKLGYICLQDLIEFGFPGRLYPVNPREKSILGLKAYPSLEAIPGEVDLAVVVIPAGQVVAAVEQCVAKGVKGVVVISGGFREAGTDTGQELQSRLQQALANSDTRLIGPNTVGVFNPRARLLASFQTSLNLARPGGVAVVTQSGGMCTYIVHALTNHNVGISKAFGLGNRCNLSFDEVVSYLAEDEDTRVICLYIEGLEQPRRLMQAVLSAASLSWLTKGAAVRRSTGRPSPTPAP